MRWSGHSADVSRTWAHILFLLNKVIISNTLYVVELETELLVYLNKLKGGKKRISPECFTYFLHQLLCYWLCRVSHFLLVFSLVSSRFSGFLLFHKYVPSVDSTLNQRSPTFWEPQTSLISDNPSTDLWAKNKTPFQNKTLYGLQCLSVWPGDWNLLL